MTGSPGEGTPRGGRGAWGARSDTSTFVHPGEAPPSLVQPLPMDTFPQPPFLRGRGLGPQAVRATGQVDVRGEEAELRGLGRSVWRPPSRSRGTHSGGPGHAYTPPLQAGQRRPWAGLWHLGCPRPPPPPPADWQKLGGGRQDVQKCVSTAHQLCVRGVGREAGWGQHHYPGQPCLPSWFEVCSGGRSAEGSLRCGSFALVSSGDTV